MHNELDRSTDDESRTALSAKETPQLFDELVPPNLTFPNGQDFPAQLPQCPASLSVPLPITGELGHPISAVCSGYAIAAATGVLVPEATMNEYNFSSGNED